MRCTKRGVNVPRVNLVDEKLGVIGLEWIEGRSVRELLGGGAEADELPDDGLQQQTQQLEEEQVEEVLNEHEQRELRGVVRHVAGDTWCGDTWTCPTLINILRLLTHRQSTSCH